MHMHVHTLPATHTSTCGPVCAGVQAQMGLLALGTCMQPVRACENGAASLGVRDPFAHAQMGLLVSCQRLHVHVH